MVRLVFFINTESNNEFRVQFEYHFRIEDIIHPKVFDLFAVYQFSCFWGRNVVGVGKSDYSFEFSELL